MLYILLLGQEVSIDGYLAQTCLPIRIISRIINLHKVNKSLYVYSLKHDVL